MGTISGDVFLGSLYGILPDFRGKGFSKRIYDAMDWICLELGLKFFKNEIHLLNLLSQKSAQSSSLVPTEIQANITFYPLLSNKSQELLLLDFILESESVFIQSVLYEVKTKFPQFHLKSIKAGYSKVISAPENVKFNINFPVQTESFLLAVCTIANRDLTGQPIFYFEFSS